MQLIVNCIKNIVLTTIFFFIFIFFRIYITNMKDTTFSSIHLVPFLGEITMANFKFSNKINHFIRIDDEMATSLAAESEKWYAHKVSDHYVVIRLRATVNSAYWWAQQTAGSHYLAGEYLYVGVSLSTVTPEMYGLLVQGEKSHSTAGLVFCYIEKPEHSKKVLTTKVAGLWESIDRTQFFIEKVTTAEENLSSKEKRVKAFEQEQTPMVQQWLKEMNKRDIYFAFSDDHSAYKTGKASIEAGIREAVASGIKDAEAIYSKWISLKING